MPLVFYYYPISQPSRAVYSLLLLGKVEHTSKIIDIGKKEQNSEEYKKINPAQAVPAIADGDFTLFESHAILRYIVGEYNLKSFYPQDPQQAGLIESYLDWHHTNTRKISGYLMKFYYGPMLFKLAVPEGKDEEFKDIQQVITFFEYVFLGQGKYKFIHNSNTVTIADLSAIEEILGLFTMNYDFDKSPILKKYVEAVLAHPEIRQANAPFFDLHKDPNLVLNDFIKQYIH